MHENIAVNQSLRTPCQVHSGDSDVLSSTRHPCADSVTGLPNRAILDWYLEHLFAIAPKPPLNSALLVIALDEIEAMRYTFGDGICNKFVRIIAQRFRAAAQPGQFVCALGADRFAFVISKNSGRERCVEVANNLLAHASAAIRIDGRMYFSTAKIGIAFTGIKSETPADLLHRARAAMQEPRLDSSDSIGFSDNDSASHASEALYTLGKLRNVSERGELCLH